MSLTYQIYQIFSSFEFIHNVHEASGYLIYPLRQTFFLTQHYFIAKANRYTGSFFNEDTFIVKYLSNGVNPLSPYSE